MKRPAEGAEEPPQKRAAVSTDDLGKSEGTYLIHDNGGRPFKVAVEWPDAKAKVKIFKQVLEDDDEDEDDEEPGPGQVLEDDEKDEDDEDDDDDEEAGPGGGGAVQLMTMEQLQQQLGGQPLLFQMAGDDAQEGEEEEPQYEEEACTSFSVEKVFVGQSPKHGAVFDGNSMLLHLEGLKYVFVGEEIFSFTAKSPITKFLSPVGNNDVPYPWAMDDQGFRYLLISSVILSGKLFENNDTDSDPYELFFDRALMTADIGMVPPQQPFHVQFQGITEFWIGEDQYTLKYEPHPEKDFDRLAEMGELSVVKGGDAKIKLPKADYVKLMQDFAELAGFETLHSETLVERNI